MGCEQNYELASDSGQYNWIREEAIRNLAMQGCTEQLYRLASDSGQYNWIRERSLTILDLFARIKTFTISGSRISLAVEGTEVVIDTVSIEIGSLETSAAKYLYDLAADSGQYNWVRERAIQSLVDGRHSDYCYKLARDSGQYNWVREKAMHGV